jgi:hypothetical protein
MSTQQISKDSVARLIENTHYDTVIFTSSAAMCICHWFMVHVCSIMF